MVATTGIWYIRGMPPAVGVLYYESYDYSGHSCPDDAPGDPGSRIGCGRHGVRQRCG